MAYNKRLLRKFNLPSKVVASNDGEVEVDNEDDRMELMSDARYLRQSSSLINEALQKGFDVLQLSSGDIVMTGTKTVTYQYTWDEDKSKLVRVKASGEGKKGRKKSEEDGSVSDEDADSVMEGSDISEDGN